jgi:hypothetical protein
MNPLTLWLCASAIEFRDGRCRPRKGRFSGHQLSAIEDLLTDSGVRRAAITLNGLGRATFSRSIPAHLHQRLRNLLVS